MPNREKWERHWGEGYDYNFKRRTFSALFNQLESEEKIGPVVVDAGSGAFPASDWLSRPHLIITIDLAKDDFRFGRRHHLGLDIETICKDSGGILKESLSKVAVEHGVIAEEENSFEVIDAAIFSELLNYVDFKQTLSVFGQYLKPNGRMVIVNKPGRGFSHSNLFSPGGIKNNSDLFDFLTSKCFAIEQKRFPWKIESEDGINQEMVILVARKILSGE